MTVVVFSFKAVQIPALGGVFKKPILDRGTKNLIQSIQLYKLGGLWLCNRVFQNVLVRMFISYGCNSSSVVGSCLNVVQ